MPRKPCFWTRKLELQLVEFIKQREYIWKPVGNTNHHIQRKYKAYAEFAASLGGGFTARSVRDRWVNIRSTFNHNLRRVYRSKEKASSAEDIYVPCWPLWRPLQFLRDHSVNESNRSNNLEEKYYSNEPESGQDFMKQENVEFDDQITLLRQRPDRPQRRSKKQKNKCRRLLNDLVTAMRPISNSSSQEQPYWFLGKHVTERLNAMNYQNAESASSAIMKLLDEWPHQATDVT